MNRREAGIYYNSDFGYIITSYAQQKGSVASRIINPVVVDTKKPLSILGEKILSSLDMTENSPPISLDDIKDFKFWHISGIKTFTTFSKKFRAIDVLENHKFLEIVERKRGCSGGYNESEDDRVIKISVNSSPEQIGQAVMGLLSNEIIVEDDAEQKFETLHNSVVSYTRPLDHFEDWGDGSTDAYQIYRHEDNNKNYIAFLIEMGYSDYTEKAIRKRWDQMYPQLSEFDFREVNTDSLKIIITAKTSTESMTSYIYKDHDAYLEVLTEINLSNTSPAVQNSLSEEFKKIIESIKIIPKG